MNERVLKTLEYKKILDMLKNYAGSEPGKNLCTKLLPLTDLESIEKMQKETADALSRVYQKGSLSFNGVPDISGAIKLLEVESGLLAGELLKISSVLTATLRVKNYGKTADETKTDSLSEMFDLLEPLTPLNNEIQRCIIAEDEIADDASAGLKAVRRQIHLTNDKIKDKLNSMINSQETKTFLQESLITMRNGRYCLPVKSECKGQFDGLVHDQSAKGSTIFMEPAAVVKLNNELTELFLKEKKEIEKILLELSSQAAVHVLNLKYDMETLTKLDFIFARALLAKNMNASEPVFNTTGYINIKKGRHPLIDPHVVVPIDVCIGKDFSLLVITGPNTGGKTVTLKTVGLFTLMGQSGLHIPAFDGSELSVFSEVFADIGDEQSIEQSLSTFSSHMTNTVRILKAADERSLCLFDELGAGTDPTEGAALAMAILNSLHEKDIRTIATTHYSELKIYALTTPCVSNACCEFDVETLRPTYRLLIGIPGKSNAFAISKKLGLSDDIIQIAGSFIGTKDKSFEDVISNLDTRRVEMEKREREINEKLAEINSLRDQLTQKYEKIDAQKEKILREANEQARDILQEAKDVADETIRKFNKMGISGIKEMEKDRADLRERLNERDEKLMVKKNHSSKKVQQEDVEYRVGDIVLVKTLNLEGNVVTLPNAKGDLTVRMGAMQTQVNKKDLRWIAHPQKEKDDKSHASTSKIAMSKSMNIHPELNLVGMRVDEALPELDKYLDDAYLSHLTKVTIIHGRGTGALMEAVQSRLKKTKFVKSYRFGNFGEGDRGVTIVEFE